MKHGGGMEFDAGLRDQIVTNLEQHDVREHALEGRRHAAVALVLLDSDAEIHGTDDLSVDRLLDIEGVPGSESADFTGRVDGTAGGAALLMTRRGAHLSAHARQWAFPGGRIDDGETPLQAALREMHEEVGLDLNEGHLLGRLDDYPTRSGYVMTPFVFWIDDDREPIANPDEVIAFRSMNYDARIPLGLSKSRRASAQSCRYRSVAISFTRRRERSCTSSARSPSRGSRSGSTN